jgi:hypothetical protein
MPDQKFEYQVVIHPLHSRPGAAFDNENRPELRLNQLGAAGYDLFSSEIAEVTHEYVGKTFQTPALIYTLRKVAS